jgi:hypothetical protein
MDMTTAQFQRLMRGQSYTRSLPKAFALAKEIDCETNTKYGIKPCMSFLDVDESLHNELTQPQVETSVSAGAGKSGFGAHSNTSHVKTGRKPETTTDMSTVDTGIVPRDITSGMMSQEPEKRTGATKLTFREQLEYIQSRESILREKELIFETKMEQMLKMMEQIERREKDLIAKESLVSLGYIVSSFDFSQEEIGQLLSSYKTKNTL